MKIGKNDLRIIPLMVYKGMEEHVEHDTFISKEAEILQSLFHIIMPRRVKIVGGFIVQATRNPFPQTRWGRVYRKIEIMK